MTWMRANLVALLALAVALPSGAYATSRAVKDSVVSRSIKDGAVKARDLAPGAVGSAAVKDDSLTGADIDESSLRLPSTGTQNRLVTNRIPPNTPIAEVVRVNGLTVRIGCTGAQGNFRLEIDQDAGVGVYRRNDGTIFGYDMPLTGWPLSGGLVDGQDAGTYVYRRAADGASVRLDFVWDNSGAPTPPPPLTNSDCVYSLDLTYTG